ncbi:MAG: hypothetical protein JXA90_04175 [Planctomycetes bacterium]|nr:hypothetical protein [Planctomycetota bacterium]
MLKRFWINNQRFVLIVGCALVLFLVSNYMISRLGRGADASYTFCRKLQKEIALLHRELKQTYAAEVSKVDAYDANEAAIRSDLCLQADPEIKPSKTLMLEFSKEIESVWASVGREASRRGVKLPEKLTADDFGIDPGDGPREYQTYSSYLRIVEQALGTLVEAGATYIGPVELIPPERAEATRVQGSEDHYCLYRGVGFAVQGTYASFIRVLEMCQEPRRFLQVRVRNLKAVRSSSGDPGELRGQVEFYGIRLEPLERSLAMPAEDAGSSEPLPGGGRR